MDKKCFKCKVEKSLDDFYRHSEMKDGHLSFCKDCVKERVSIYAKTSAGKLVSKRRDRTERRKKWKMEFQKKYRMKYPDKLIAHRKISNSLRDKKIEKKPCEICGNQKSEAHHPDYSKPLEVIWLCFEHHRGLHRVLF